MNTPSIQVPGLNHSGPSLQKQWGSKGTIFLTGASGLLGNNLSRELLSRGYRVVAFIPFGEATPTLDHLSGLEIRRGNLLKPEEVKEAMEGCDAVIHAGANTTVSPARHPMIRKVNVEGTRHIITAVLALGIPKMVNVASSNIFGYGSITNPGDESHPFNCGRFGLDYQTTKLEAYHEVQCAVHEHGLHAVTVCPTFMLGAYDTKPSSGAMLIALSKGKIPASPKGGRNYVHVRDVATATVNAMEFGRSGEAYILGNSNMDYRTAYALMAKVMRINPPRFQLPDLAIKTFGALSSTAGYLLRKNPTITYKMTRIACEGFYYSAEKAIRELQLPQTPIETAIMDAKQWFTENGYLPMRKPSFYSFPDQKFYEKAAISK